MTKQERIDLLDREGIIKDEKIDFGNNEAFPKQFPDNNNNNMEFENCHIIAKALIFENIRNKKLTIRFKDCNIEAKIIFRNCIIQGIYFDGTKSLKSLELESGYEKDNVFEVEQFQFKNETESDNILDCAISIYNCTFKNEFIIYGLKHSGFEINLIRNRFGVQDIDSEIGTNFLFQNSTFKNIWFHENVFYDYSSFIKCTFIRNRLTTDIESFSSNVFKEVKFNYCDFQNGEKFVSCTFNDVAYFNFITNIETGKLSIKDCMFSKKTSFNNAKINTFLIEETTFHNIVSFQDAQFKNIKIDKPSFEKTVYFDGLRIDDISKCDIGTIRTIKQQLQKSENRIDYSRFRNYELQAYYQQLNGEENKKLDKDRLILLATKHVTGFDHSWKKALGFTLKAAFVFFSLFFIAENYDSAFSWSGIPQYITGYFRFLLVTDFYNPLISNGREYISNDGWNHIASWFIFILGKIVIAFGIYEMIQAFRKFKA